MRLTIRHNNSYLIEFDQLKVNGREAASGYAFSFILLGARHGCDSLINLIDIRLSILLPSAKPLVINTPSTKPMVACDSYFNNSEQLSFDMVLTKEQINAVEGYRQEGDLRLQLELKALVASKDHLLPSFDTASVVIPREQWLKALGKAGFRQTLLFEVPLPPTAKEIEAFICKAQSFIEAGHYKDAVMQCRHIIEYIEKVRADKQEASLANKKAYGNERKAMSPIERLLSLREQLKNICQLGAHGSESFTRSQAKTVLAMTMALLAEPTVGFNETTTKGFN